MFDKKNFGKMNYKRKIFITKIYSNIDKRHTIFALRQHPSTEQGERQRVMKTSVAYDSKQAVSRARIGRNPAPGILILAVLYPKDINL